jgi:hypothetical protein
MAAVVVCATIVTPSVAVAKEKTQHVSAPYEYANPYQGALECLATQLTPAQRDTTVGIGYFADRTGRQTFADQGAFGSFLSGGMEDALLGDLRTAGMTAIEVGGSYRQLSDWMTVKYTTANSARAPEDRISIPIAMPDAIVHGSFSTVDFGPSSVGEIRVFGIGGGKRKYSLRYTADVRISSAPGAVIHNDRYQGQPTPGAVVLEHLSLVKDVVGRGGIGGGTAFFGPARSSTLIEVNFEKDKRQLIQYSQRYMTSRAAFGLVAGMFNVTACDELLAYGDALIANDFPDEGVDNE